MASPPDQKPQRKPRKPRATAATPPVPAPARMGPLAMTLIVAGAIVALDQALKVLVVHYLDLKTVRQIDVIDPFLNLRMAWNEGVNFGLFASGESWMRWVLIAIALAISIWVAVWTFRTRPGRFAQASAGLLIGGALGNVIDRVLYGAVADFLNMSLPGWSNPFSFNVADIAVFAGAIGLVLQPQQTPPDAPAAKLRDGRGKTG